jgi:RNA polymerase sigma-70 factor (ECF subfamily)
MHAHGFGTLGRKVAGWTGWTVPLDGSTEEKEQQKRPTMIRPRDSTTEQRPGQSLAATEAVATDLKHLNQTALHPTPSAVVPSGRRSAPPVDVSRGADDADMAEDILVQLAITGDARAFSRLHARYHDRIYRHAYYRVGRQHQDAEDLTQQVFLKAWRALDRYRVTGRPFWAWLLAITRNTVTSHYRRPPLGPSLESDVRDWPSEEHLERDVEAHVECERVGRALRHLPQRDQRVLTMRLVGGLAYRDIAGALGISEANARAIQHRAVHHLRRMLA